MLADPHASDRRGGSRKIAAALVEFGRLEHELERRHEIGQGKIASRHRVAGFGVQLRVAHPRREFARFLGMGVRTPRLPGTRELGGQRGQGPNLGHRIDGGGNRVQLA